MECYKTVLALLVLIELRKMPINLGDNIMYKYIVRCYLASVDDVWRVYVTAALVGGMLLCIVAIILSVCTVKICNKRKRKKQEKGKNIT